MAKLFGRELTKREILARVGDVSQITRATDFCFTSGRAEGMRGIEVHNGSGLTFTVLPSRGMDMAFAAYKGIPLAFISKSGLGSPAYFEKDGLSFLRNFTCGLMTTCGLTYMGAPCTDQGEELGLHGRIGNIGAQNCGVNARWEDDSYRISLTGQAREAAMFGENMVLNREIETGLGENRITVTDTIVNEGFTETPFMLLYHCNFGWPLIGKNTVLKIDTPTVRSRDPRAEEGIAEWDRFDDPVPGFTEQLYYFAPQAKPDGYAEAVLENPDLLANGLRVKVRFTKDSLPYCSEWKQIGEGDYVVGIEPSTWLPEGRAKARERGELRFLAPGESVKTQVIYEVEEM